MNVDEILRRMVAAGESPPPAKAVLAAPTLDGLKEYLDGLGRPPRIVTMVGAGVSTSAGIPDFRSPGTGLYDNLQKYNLPYPQAIFELDFFRTNPEPFCTLARSLYPGEFKPTPSHYFIKLLALKGVLQRHYTQNIDTLEREAGVPDELLVEAHGSFHAASCIDCDKEHSREYVRERIFADDTPVCVHCNGLVKPNIVFFGESLPERFHKLSHSDLAQADLLVVAGTSLQVQPFASLVGRVGGRVPRVLINREKCGEGPYNGFNFEGSLQRDIALLGDCDEGFRRLAEVLGWADDLERLCGRGEEVGETETEETETEETETGETETGETETKETETKETETEETETEETETEETETGETETKETETKETEPKKLSESDDTSTTVESAVATKAGKDVYDDDVDSLTEKLDTVQLETKPESQ